MRREMDMSRETGIRRNVDGRERESEGETAPDARVSALKTLPCAV